MTSDRLDHMFIAAQSFDAAPAYYRNALGWQIAHRWGSANKPRGAILDGGRVRWVLAVHHETSDHSWPNGIKGARPTDPAP